MPALAKRKPKLTIDLLHADRKLFEEWLGEAAVEAWPGYARDRWSYWNEGPHAKRTWAQFIFECCSSVGVKRGTVKGRVGEVIAKKELRTLIDVPGGYNHLVAFYEPANRALTDDDVSEIKRLMRGEWPRRDALVTANLLGVTVAAVEAVVAKLDGRSG